MKKSVVASAVAVAFAAGLFAAQFGAHRMIVADSHAVPGEAAVAEPARQAAVPLASLPDFTALVESQGPAVVNISVTKAARAPGAQGGPSGEPPIPEFFRPSCHNPVSPTLRTKDLPPPAWVPASSSAPTATCSPTPTW
jgi:serine protease Do